MRVHSHAHGDHVLFRDEAFNEPVRKRFLERFRKRGVLHVAIDGVNLGIHRREILQPNAKSFAGGGALPDFVVGRGSSGKILRRRWQGLAFVGPSRIFLNWRHGRQFGQRFVELFGR